MAGPDRAGASEEFEMNTVQKLATVGQSIWYDNIERGMLQDGEMAGMIARGEIRGVTSNPTDRKSVV